MTDEYNIFERMAQVRRLLPTMAPKLFHIRTKDRGIVPWTPSLLQTKLLTDDKLGSDIILKARQLGISTMTVLEFLAYLLFVDGFNGIIISEDLEKSKQLMQIVSMALDMLPEQYRVPMKYGRQEYFITEAPIYDKNGKRIGGGRGSSLYIGTAGKFTLGRGNTYHAVHCSELAFWPVAAEKDAETLLTGLEEAVPDRPGAILRIESTANGRGNTFHTKCEQARAGVGRYRFNFFPWWYSLDDEYRKEVKDRELLQGKFNEDEEHLIVLAKKQYGFTLGAEHLQWRRDKIAAKKEQFWQEYPEDPDTCFLATGSMVFHAIADLLDHVRKRLEGAEPIVTRPMHGIEVKFWKMPRAGQVYAMGVDMAEGDKISSDFNALVLGHILPDGRCEEAVTAQGRTGTDNWAQVCMELADMYNGAMIAVERAVRGYGLLDTLVREEGGQYDYTIYHHMEFDQRAGKEAKVGGFRPTQAARDAAVNRWATDVAAGDYIPHDPLVVGQALSFQFNPRTGKMEAPRGSYDDMLAASLILNYVKGEADVQAKVGVEEW